WKKAAVIVAILIIAASLGVVVKQDEEGTGQLGGGASLADWTCIFYFCGDNNLADYNQMLFNLECLERVGSTDNVHLICLLDRNEGNDTRLLYIEQGESMEFQLSEVNDTWGGELNLGDPQVLVDYTNWCVDEYPAHNYNLMLSNHGGGWRGICWDDASDGDNLDLQELTWATSRIAKHMGKNISVLSTEACLVGMVEFTYSLYGSVDYFLGGETYGYGGENTTEGGILVGNWQFEKTWGALSENPNMTGEELAKLMVADFQEYGPWRAPLFIPKPQSSDCMAAIRVAKIPEVVRATDALASSLQFRTRDGVGRERVTASILSSESFSGQLDFIGLGSYTNYDLYSLAEHFGTTFMTDAIQNAVSDVLAGVEEAVLVETHGDNKMEGDHPEAHGLAIYFPLRSDEYNEKYEDTAFAEDTAWDEFIRAYWRLPA
ncbi:MAG: hypothetical protein KAT70_09735, partial [Thermoplasmata archaeon]|nr:hypothetical protein [Thermoplasmata archaeon]